MSSPFEDEIYLIVNSIINYHQSQGFCICNIKLRTLKNHKGWFSYKNHFSLNGSKLELKKRSPLRNNDFKEDYNFRNDQQREGFSQEKTTLHTPKKVERQKKRCCKACSSREPASIHRPSTWTIGTFFFKRKGQSYEAKKKAIQKDFEESSFARGGKT